SYTPTINISETTMKKGRADEISGERNKTGGRKPRKNAIPPKVGVGRACHRSFFGSATQPHCLARRAINGTHKTVSKNELAGTRNKTALPQAVFIESLWLPSIS